MKKMDNMEKVGKKSLKKGDLLKLKISNLDTKGRAYGFHAENKIYVNINAAAEQIVEGIFVKRRRKYELINCKIIDFAGRKNMIYDDIARQNGGCNYQYYTYGEQLAIKTEHIRKELSRIIKNDYIFEEPIKSPKPEKYRNKMEFSFGNMEKGGEMILGLHRQNSFHDIVEVEGLKLMDDNFNKIYIFCNEFCKKFSKETGLNFYHRLSHIGFFRNLVIRKAEFSKQILVNIITTTQIDKAEKEKFQKEFKEGLLALKLTDNLKITGILHTFNDNLSDMVISESETILYGGRDLIEKLFGLKFKISPYSFFQTNSDGVELLYEKVMEYIDNIDETKFDIKEEKIKDTKDCVIFDLFSGTGTIGQIVSKKAKYVYGIELIEEAVKKANENTELNNIENAEFIAGDVFEKLEELEKREIKPDIIILDPPRAGIGEKTITKLMKYNVSNIIYVSCNPKTLVQDLITFQNNSYKIKQVCPVDMFPFTPHVETVALLSKLNVDKHIDVEIKLDELDLTSAESKASYAQIKEYILEKFDLKVSTLYIAQIKKKCGIVLREHYNKSKKEKQVIPQCTLEKEEAIMDALRHFKMI